MFKNKKNMDMCIVFAVALLPRLVLIFLFGGIFRTPMDEMSTIATGAYFGGKDWTALTTYAKFYYGGGFTILFAPLFRLIDNTQVVYYLMLSVCAVLQSISAPISYHVMNRYLKIDNRKYLGISAVACSYMVVTRAMEVFNEHIIIGGVWISVLLICRLVDNKDNYKKRAIDSTLLMLVFFYLLTVHTRTNVIWIAFTIVVICYFYVYKRWLVAIIPTIITAAIGYFAAGRFNYMVKTVIWNWQEGDFLRNTNVNIKISLSDLKNPVYWQGILSTIFGQLNTITIFTGGLAVIIIVMFCYLYINILTSRVKAKKALLETSEVVEENIKPYILVISVLFVLCAGAVIATQSITWLDGLVKALQNNTYESNAYRYKAVTYVRYMGPFLGPILMVGLGYIYYMKNEMRKYIVPSIFSIGVLQMIWLGFILPHITRSRSASEAFVAFGWYDIVNSTHSMNIKVYLIGSLVLGIVVIISLVAYYRRKIFVPIILVTMLLIYEYCYGAVFWDGSYAKYFESNVDAGVDIIQNIEKDENYSNLLPNTIYVYDAAKNVQKRMYTYQMNLSNYKIIAGRPDDSSDDKLVFASIPDDEELIAMGYEWGMLDDNEYVYVNAEAYIEMFEAQGIEFSTRK